MVYQSIKPGARVSQWVRSLDLATYHQYLPATCVYILSGQTGSVNSD